MYKEIDLALEKLDSLQDKFLETIRERDRLHRIHLKDKEALQKASDMLDSKDKYAVLKAHGIISTRLNEIKGEY